MDQHAQAIIITIGDELLIGQVVDTNSAWMGQQLSLLGITVKEKLAISDSRQSILDTLAYATTRADVILITGGLGPTKDDITKKVIAEYYADEMVWDQGTWDRIEGLFARWGRPTTEAHRGQCYMPSSCELLPNKMGTAPGMLFKKEHHMLISMPGVPYEMKYIMSEHILPLLKDRYQGTAIVHRTIMTAGEGESRIADRIEAIVDAMPPHMSMAYLPSLGKVRLRITATGTDETTLRQEIKAVEEPIVAELGDLVFGYDDISLVNAIANICLEKGITIGTAESCTGGKVASMIVNEAGSSAYYQGSLVTYSNELKQQLLAVGAETLAAHGAVSEQTVIEMVAGARRQLRVDVAVAISGIAGPSGGSDEKPVGTIWVACGNENKTETYLIKAGKNREKNIEYAANYALIHLRRFILQQC